MEIIGSDKIGFIYSPKHGINTLMSLRDYDFINRTFEDYPSEKIVLFPWRDEFEYVKSGFFEDIKAGLKRLLSGNLSDENLLGLLRYIFNKKNNASVLNVNIGDHKKICVSRDFFPYFLTDNDKFYFFDLKHLSNPKLIEWISERDPQWKNVSIPHKNSSLMDPGKIKIKNILSQIKEELGEDYLDYNNINNWPTFKHYYEFSKIFFESRKKSKQFLNFD
jgi:hypothetical protein